MRLGRRQFQVMAMTVAAMRSALGSNLEVSTGEKRMVGPARRFA